ncbi:hypothetical protein Tco_0574149 [Tanacetum coccineum]
MKLSTNNTETLVTGEYKHWSLNLNTDVKALDDGSVITESSGTKSNKHDTSSSSGTYITHVVDADIRPVLTNKTVENADLKTQIQEKVFANVALKNELRNLKRNNVDTKFSKPSILGKTILQPPINQSVVRQPNAFKSERPIFSKQRFASQVDVINNLPKPVTPHYLPKVRESVFVKPHHVIASGSSWNSSKELYGSNGMPHKWKPTGKIFTTVGLKWIPTGKLFDSCTSKADCKPTHGSNGDTSKIHECKQTLELSTGTSINVQKEQSFELSAEEKEGTQQVEAKNQEKEGLEVISKVFESYSAHTTHLSSNFPVKISPPKDAETPVESPIPISPSSSVGSSSPVRSTIPPPDYPFDKSIFAELDNSLWIIPQPLGSEPVP